jgi:hypothetical protein
MRPLQEGYYGHRGHHRLTLRVALGSVAQEVGQGEIRIRV